MRWFEWATCEVISLAETTTNNNINNTQVEVETQQVTTFYNDETVVEQTIQRPLEYNRLLSNSLRETRSHEILDFLGRPVQGSVNWDITGTSGSLLLSINNPSTLISNAMMSDKMSGFLGFRGTFVLRITINCSRFMQGRLMVVYIPSSTFLGTDRFNTIVSNLVTLSQLPRVELDAASQTEAILRVPFIYPYEAYKLNGGNSQLGTFRIQIYSPLISPTGDTSVPVTYWMHFEDAELLYPTTFVAQVEDVFEAQSVGDNELAASGLPTPSRIFGRISKAATILSRIPLLSSVALPVAWASGILSDAASALGFSNPKQSSPASRMLAQKTPYINNVNAVDNSLSLGFFSDNSVEILPGAMGTDIDELSITSLVMRPTYFRRFTWASTGTQGTRLYSQATDPSQISQVAVVADNLAINHAVDLNSPASYVRSFFAYWRGSLCFTLKFVKTEFHSGRLVIAWFPGVTGSPTNLSGSEQVYKEVVDIRANNEFQFCIPYVSVQPWSSSATGSLGIYILNPLRAPSTVSQSIDVLIEGCMGEDAAFSVHNTTNWTPTLGLFTAQCDDVWEAQSLGLDDSHCNQVTVGATAMGSKPNDDAIIASKFCIGELVTSVRQLLKRAVVWNVSSLDSEGVMTIFPFQQHLPFLVAGAPFPSTTYFVDYYSSFVSMFAFSRGGVRLKMWDTAGVATVMSARLKTTSISPILNFSTTVSGGNVTNSDAVFVNVGQTGALEVEVPQYTQLKMRANPVSTSLTTSSQSELTARGALEVTWHTTTPNSNLVVYRQVADDFNCGFFIGALPTTSITNTGAGVWG